MIHKHYPDQYKILFYRIGHYFVCGLFDDMIQYVLKSHCIKSTDVLCQSPVCKDEICYIVARNQNEVIVITVQWQVKNEDERNEWRRDKSNDKYRSKPVNFIIHCINAGI